MSSWRMEQEPERIPVSLPEAGYRRLVAELAEFLYDHFQGQLRSKKVSSPESVDSPKPALAA
jgi:hypothetical protein